MSIDPLKGQPSQDFPEQPEHADLFLPNFLIDFTSLYPVYAKVMAKIIYVIIV